MKCIVLADKNWGIGKKGRMPVNIPADMKLANNETIRKTIIMGRKTFESNPANQIMSSRRCIVLTKNKQFRARNIITAYSVDQALEFVKDVDTDDVYVMGGEQIYKAFLEYCDEVLVTKIDYTYESDAFFENLDQASEWELTEESEEQTYFNLEYKFCKYNKK